MAVFPPRRDSELLAFSANVKARLTASPTDYKVQSTQVTDYGERHDAFAAAYQAAYDPITRTRGKIQARNLARDALLVMMRSLCGMILKNVEVSDELKVDLGLNIPRPPAPQPVPQSPPNIDVMLVRGTMVRCRLHGDDPGRRGRPEFVSGATIFSFIGDAPPVDHTKWQFVCSTGKTTIDIPFPEDLAIGTQVWITAFWFNNRKDSSPIAPAVGARLMGGGSATVTA